MSEPLPCPMCAATASVKTARGGEDFMLTWVQCDKCGLRTDEVEDAYSDRPTAIGLWNIRHQPSPERRPKYRCFHCERIVYQGETHRHPAPERAPDDEVREVLRPFALHASCFNGELAASPADLDGHSLLVGDFRQAAALLTRLSQPRGEDDAAVERSQRFVEFLLKDAGCKCVKPLLGWHESATGLCFPRCRSCNTIAALARSDVPGEG